ncbi:MAG TPA: DUF3592 domain-containing protein [Gemmatimonadaceae bacterium]|nr:DUF3592 domain-containing protein [Gemmatimonadaceae bacterium]
MLVLWVFLGCALLAAAIGAGLLLQAVRWARKAQELQQYGVPASAVIRQKRMTTTRGGTSRYVPYEYADQFGRRHRSRKSIVTPEQWEASVEGGPIAVVYSQRRPHISMPTSLLALGKAGTAPNPRLGKL